ncbi:RIMS-binding protein 2-like [Limulus polyphemus]|uniref:RIMS-binding protein 2-like n=1 Tax=Limulus polyphemus TaxID=6850 RepID=A0ABM1BJ00_LIMPO|nr:RIMS-binding protein 2-like [Limulus polyphemus]
MREAAEKRKELEKEHAEALAELLKCQENVRVLGQSKESEKQQSLELIKSLESKVRELQKKCELQNVLHEELVLEMAALRRSQAKRAWSTQRSHSADIPHDQESHVAHELDRILASTGTLMSSTYGQYSSSIPPLSLSSAPSSSLPYLDQINLLSHTSAPWTDSSTLSYSASKVLGQVPSTSYKLPEFRLSSVTTTSGSFLTSISSAVPAPLTVKPALMEKLSFTSSSLSTPAMLESASKEIDRILQRIEQDNRLLAELDKSRRTFSSSVPGSPIFSESAERMKVDTEGETRLKEEISHIASKLKPSFSSPAIDQLLLEPQRSKQMNSQLARYRGIKRSSVTRRELEQLMVKLEQDNKILADLDRKRSQYGRPSVPLTSSHLSSVSSLSGGNVAPFGMTAASIPQAFQTIKPLTSAPQAFQTTKPVPASVSIITGTAPAGTHVANTYSLTKKHPTAPYTTSTTAVVAVPVTAGSISAHNGTTVTSVDETRKVTGTEEDALGESSIDHIELPGRGCCKVYIARYTYDPLQQSPNENPEAELALNAGDYVLIFGEMDEDGFFNGELLDGRKGLVPSNFVEMLCGEELFDFQTTVLYGNRDSDDSSASFTVAADYDFAGFSGTEEMYSLPPEDYHRMNDYIDLEDIEEVDEDYISDIERETEGPTKTVPSVQPPQRLILERQLNKSILIGWLPPEGPLGDIQMYHVYVDGVLKATVQSSERTRALVEGVDSSQLHRISVRSVTSSGHHSRDAACTITVGKDLPLAPSCVKASNVTSTSALISWLPSNSNFTHSIAVNNVEIRVVKPGRFRHTITGLAPNTLYRVSVRAKPGKLLYNAEKNPKNLDMLTTFVDFRTLPKGLPDPPVDIQVEAGPQDGTLLVTWLPVTINPTGTSNGAPVTGYAVFAAGKKVTEIDSPTGDHALLEVKDLFPLANKSVTVRTKSGDNLSSDSMPCVIPEELIKTSSQKVSSDSELDVELTEVLSHVAHRSQAFDPDCLSQQHKRNRVRDSTTGNGDIGRDHVKGGRDQISPRRSGMRTASDDRSHQQSFDSPPSGRKYVSRPHERRVNHLIEERRNSAGQVIIEPDENLSDKEIYPSQNHVPIPSIEITKDSASEGCNSMENFSEEEYEAMRRAHRVQPKGYPPDLSRSRGGQPQVYSVDRIGPRPVSPTKGRRLPRDDQDYYNYQEEPLVSHGREDNYPMDSYRGGVSYRSQPHMDVNHQDNRVRWFVALFDYNPHTMSPNPDAAEELPFQEGQLIKIYGGKDPDGFYRGETNGRVGFVPCNMVSEVQLDDEEVAQHLLNENIASRPRPLPDDIDSGSSMPLRKMVALYDYDPQELSPNVDAEMELSFNTGDVIYVYGDMDEDGFFMGEINGVRGLVPSNFLTEAPPDYRDNQPVPRERLGPPVVGNVSRPKVAEEPDPSRPGNHPEKPGAWLASCSILPTSTKLENHHPSIPEAQPTRPQALKRTIFLHKIEGDTSRIAEPMIEARNGLPILPTEVTTHQGGDHNAGNKRPTTLALKPESRSLKQSKNFETDGKMRRNRKKGIISPKYERKSLFSSMKNLLKPLWRT